MATRPRAETMFGGQLLAKHGARIWRTRPRIKFSRVAQRHAIDSRRRQVSRRRAATSRSRSSSSGQEAAPRDVANHVVSSRLAFDGFSSLPRKGANNCARTSHLRDGDGEANYVDNLRAKRFARPHSGRSARARARNRSRQGDCERKRLLTN